MGTHPLAGHYKSKADFIAGTFAKLGKVLPDGAQLRVEHLLVADDEAVVELHSEATAKNGFRFDNRFAGSSTSGRTRSFASEHISTQQWLRGSLRRTPSASGNPERWEAHCTPLLRKAFRTSQYAGMPEPEFGPTIERTFKARPGEGSPRARNAASRCSFPSGAGSRSRASSTERSAVSSAPRSIGSKPMLADTDVPNEMWANRPVGQLEKCALSFRLGLNNFTGGRHSQN